MFNELPIWLREPPLPAKIKELEVIHRCEYCGKDMYRGDEKIKNFYTKDCVFCSEVCLDEMIAEGVEKSEVV